MCTCMTAPSALSMVTLYSLLTEVRDKTFAIGLWLDHTGTFNLVYSVKFDDSWFPLFVCTKILFPSSWGWMFSTRLALLKVHTVDSLSKIISEWFTTFLLRGRERSAYKNENYMKTSYFSKSAQDISPPQGSSTSTPPSSCYSSGTPSSSCPTMSPNPTFSSGWVHCSIRASLCSALRRLLQ